MTRRKKAKPRKALVYLKPPPVELNIPYRPEYAFAGGAYWCRSIGLFPVIEPYINAGGVSGKGFGIRASWFGGNAYAEWWKP